MVYPTFPSSPASSSPVTVTVWGASQSPDVKVRLGLVDGALRRVAGGDVNHNVVGRLGSEHHRGTAPIRLTPSSPGRWSVKP